MFQQNIFLMYKYRSPPGIPAGNEMLKKDHWDAGPCTIALLVV